MSTDTLDMSILAEDWHCGKGELHRLYADPSHPLTLDFTAVDVEPPPFGRVLIMQALVQGQEIWAIRMLPSGRLWIQPGTKPSRETAYGYVGRLAMGVSFNPESGALSIVVRNEDGAAESFHPTACTPWASTGEGYEILLGAPESYADLSPIGWRIDCSFRYGEPVEEPLRGDPSIRKGVGEIVSRAQALAESVQDLDNERHWEAMLAIVARGGDLDHEWIASEAAALVNAHNAWKEGR